MRTASRSLLLVTVMTGALLFAGSWYMVTNPQRSADRIMRLLRQVQVGQTSTQQLAELFNTEGVRAHSTWCGQTRVGYQCEYTFITTNALLHFIRLAPLSGLSGSIKTNDKVVIGIGFSSAISYGDLKNCDVGGRNCDFGYFAHIDVGQGLENMRLGHDSVCEQPVCIKRVNITPPGYPDGVVIGVSSSAPIVERNRVFALNTACFSKIGGCRNERELLPIEELK